jgi:hypothetical protein
MAGLSGIFYEEAIVRAVGLVPRHEVSPWFSRVEQYGERAWRVAGPELAAVCWDCGNGWMTMITLEPTRAVDPDQFRALAVGFWQRLFEAVEAPAFSGALLEDVSEEIG